MYTTKKIDYREVKKMLAIPPTGQVLPFDEEEIRRDVKRFKALGDVTRLKMVRLLETGDHCVCEIMEVFDIGQSTASHHLKILENAGLILSRREGKFVYYQIIPRSLN
ncbi:MAG TPA: metalloregulator ArsR/SmtB family transcription factor [Desulfosporosinus sp.]|nr:metalloregulator ArsR/SmtB family transcription factor [Desulfosporosinus sp.]